MRALLATCAAGVLACASRPEPSTGITGPGTNPRLAALFEELRRDPHGDLKGVIVVMDGRVAGEAYFNGDGPETLHDLRSAGKSITSLLVGIAIDRGAIRDIDEPLAKLLTAPGLEGITLRDAVTMRTGLAADDSDPSSPGNEDRMDEAPDWLAFAAALPRRTPPGQHYIYASVNAFLAGAAVERATGVPLQELAARHLFRPLGIDTYRWRTGPRGEGTGQGNLRLRLRDAAKIGELVLHRGMVGKTRIVSEGWIDASLAPQVPIATVDPFADHYGYMWYRKTYSVGASIPARPGGELPRGQDSGGRSPSPSITVHFASGNGGNKIYVVPDYRLVVCITSSAYGRRYGQSRSEAILLEVLETIVQ